MGAEQRTTRDDGTSGMFGYVSAIFSFITLYETQKRTSGVQVVCVRVEFQNRAVIVCLGRQATNCAP